MIAERLAQTVMQRIEALGQISDESGRLTRTFGSPAMRCAHELVTGWMREAGMTTRQDAMGNLIGHYPGQRPDANILLFGSHLDTVRDAGKYDGTLGVLVGIACVQHLHDQQRRLPFALEVVGFADEEGVRYQSAYLGSRVLAGTFNEADLKRVDAAGITMAEAVRQFGGDEAALKQAQLPRNRLLGYVEVHIEQGPVLEQRHLAVGVVSAILGQTRAQVRFTGRAGHAGTTPMSLRRDALVPAAEFIVSVELFTRDDPDLVATVGQVEVRPGASNVIPGEVRLSVDVRHRLNEKRAAATAHLETVARDVARKRGTAVDWEIVQQTESVPCAPELSALLGQAVRQYQGTLIELPSGAGHDAAVMAAVTSVAMLFVRCRGGISHHPDEAVQTQDVAMAIAVMLDFLDRLASQCAAVSVGMEQERAEKTESGRT
jgi:allantoate deiminase